MADTKTFVANAVAWVDLASKDAAGSRDFYSKLFGWKPDVEADPNAGGYALAKIDGKDVAGIGPTQDPNQPTAWSVYIGSNDVGALAKKVEAAGGKVIAPPFDVLDSGRMAVFQDPSGAFISGWQPKTMNGFGVSQKMNTFSWAELNARGIDKAKDFYTKVFGWTIKDSPLGEGMGDYTEFKLSGENVAGGMEMMSMVPPQVPSYWLVYFQVADLDKAHKKAVDLGGKEIMAPAPFPGGRFSLLTDPQGASFGLIQAAAK